MSARYTELLYKFPAYNEGHVADMSWKSGARAIDKLERHTMVSGTLKQELLKRQYVVFGSECVKTQWGCFNWLKTHNALHRKRLRGWRYRLH